MPAVSISPAPKLQFFTAAGAPLVGGKVYTYSAGTSTPYPTYTDSTGNVANANPITLDARGEASIWLEQNVAYKFEIRDASNVLIYTQDNVYSLAQVTAANVNFTQSGTGAVTRSVQSKLREAVSVKDFGAVGDGVTDDTTAIQRAINSVSASGGVVYLPPGTFVVSSPLTVPVKVAIEGAGLGVTFLSATTAMTNSQAVFYAATGNLVSFCDFSIFGNTTGVLGAGTGIHVKSGAGAKIERVYISNTTQAGIRLEEVNTVLVDKCWLESCGRVGYSDNHGIMIYSQSGSTVANFAIKILNNVIRNSYRKGITNYGPNADFYDILIQGNTIEGSGLGNIYIGTVQSRNIRIIKNHCYGGYVNIQLGECKNGIVADNVCEYSTGDFGIGVFGLNACVISNNVVKTSATQGIKLWSPAGQTCNQVIISNNIVMNSNRNAVGAAAVELASASYCVLNGNNIWDENATIAASYGIYEFATSDYNSMASNIIFNNINGNFFISGANTMVQEVLSGTSFRFAAGFQVNHVALTLANGANNDVTLPSKAGTVTITGPTAVFSITGIKGGALGRTVKLVNSTSFAMTLKINDVGSAASNRLFLTSSVDKVIPAWSAVSLTYVQNQGSNFWVDV